MMVFTVQRERREMVLVTAVTALSLRLWSGPLLKHRWGKGAWLHGQKSFLPAGVQVFCEMSPVFHFKLRKGEFLLKINK